VIDEWIQAKPVTKDELQRDIGKIRWWHQIDLGNGIVTPGGDTTLRRIADLGLPEDLSGKSVLDIGAWDGAFSFECERRGAARVLATDSFVWEGKTWGSKEGFELARRALGSRVEDLLIDVFDLTASRVGTFDVVLFAGVLYHLKHPLLALERVAEVTGGQLILNSHINLTNLDRPAMAFYPGSEQNNDASNWWGPNVPALRAMLQTVGFRKIEVFREVDQWATLHAWK
jgi:tRNA (mo5U34)-methyltransferase